MKCILEWLKENHIYRINAPVMAYRNDFSLLSKLNNDSARDFTFHLNFQNKTFWEKCILGKILYLGWIGYKDKHQELKNRYGIMLIYIIIAKIGIQINKIRI